MSVPAMQMVNMFGAIRPRQKDRLPYDDTKRSTVPTQEEARDVLEKMRAIDANKISLEDLPIHHQALHILSDLSNGDARGFLALDQTTFEQLNQYIGETLAHQQYALLEQQAKQESDEFLKQNTLLFDHLREEGLNYDHLSDEQLEILRLRLRERDLSERMERNASKISGSVHYHYALGPDDRFYKSGGVVLLEDEKEQIDKAVIDEVRQENSLDLKGHFADADILKLSLLGKNNQRTTR